MTEWNLSTPLPTDPSVIAISPARFESVRHTVRGPEPGLPRLLLISAAIPETMLAGSVLLFRLLQTYPPDRLMAVGPAPRVDSVLLSCPYRVLTSAPSARLNVTRFARLKRSFEAIGIVGRIPLKRIESLVEDFVPDVVLSVMEQRDYVDAAHRFCVARHLPLILIVHDRLESFETVYPPFSRLQRRRNAETYRFAAERLCVSPEMEASRRDQYGAPGAVLYPNRSDTLRARAAHDSLYAKEPGHVTLGYAGSLAYGYEEAIRQLMPALTPLGVRLRIYSRDPLSEPVGGVVHQGRARTPEEIWDKVKAECDAVWLPYSYSARYEALYRTHFPSKLPEYLALGMPVLISGPAYATGVRWGERHGGAALTVSGDSEKALQSAVIRLRDDASIRVKLATEALIAGNDEFDPAAIRTLFMNTLRAVSNAREPV
jgi:glycosyltransferase involved in cell wall biosynthesis